MFSACILSATSDEGHGEINWSPLFKENTNLYLQDSHHITWDTSQTVPIFSYHKENTLETIAAFDWK